MVLEGAISVILNTILFVFKYIIGVMTGSIALVADAWHTLSDSVSSVVVIIGGFYSQKPADKGHPFGHGRIELITSIIIGIMLLGIAYSFAREAYHKFKLQIPAVFGTAAYVVTIVTIVLKEILAQYSFWAGKKVNSSSLISDGWHHRSDALSSIIVLIGILIGGKIWWMDSILAFIIAIIIAWAGIQILLKTCDSIIGESPKQQMIDSIKDIAKSIENIDANTLHHFHIHRYGTHTEITFHIKFPNNTTVYNAHTTATDLELAIKEKLGMESTIHIESAK